MRRERSVTSRPRFAEPTPSTSELGSRSTRGRTGFAALRRYGRCCASLAAVRADLSGGLEPTACHGRVARPHAAPIDVAITRPEVRQRETIAGGFGGGLPAADLAQVPVIELVAVEEAQHLAAGPEADGPAEPLKGQPATGVASRPNV